MKPQQTSLVPFVIVVSVLTLVCFLQALPRLLPVVGRPGESHFDLFERIEWMTYDWRMRWAFTHGSPVATNLAAVLIDDHDLERINQDLGYHWPWPRQLFGQAIRELQAQQCQAVACDIFFLERHSDFAETRVILADQTVGSDAFLAMQMHSAGNVILGCPGEIVAGRWRLLPPWPLFRTNAADLGYASTDRDPDGVLRRTKPFRDDPQFGRVWHLGLRLAAAHLGLDLTNAVVEPTAIHLRSATGLTRTIPLTEQGYFLIDWSLAWYDNRLANATFEDLLDFDRYRQRGETNLEPALQHKLVVIGSIGSGSNISDIGASPLAKETYLVSKHWNVANSLLLDRFVRPMRWWQELLVIVTLGTCAGWLTWRLRALAATACVAALISGYTLLALWSFVEYRVWLPLTLPVVGALAMTHGSLVTWRVAFEQNERRRVKAIFARVVAPAVVDELLDQGHLSLGGALREMTVLFADIRGFTQFTDENQRLTQEYVRMQSLRGAGAEAAFEENARETLSTVNRYLAVIADNVKKHRGTLDKYIGDCAMAFWGAPIANAEHAVAAVRAAIDSQRAIAELNRQRAEENRAIETENVHRRTVGLPLLRTRAILSLGTGINTGVVTVGLMGSDTHGLNYTVFGREVNLASRLEGVSGHARIVISATTYAALQRQAPELASRCVPLPPVTVKGISEPVPIVDVLWRESEPTAS